MKFLYEVRIYEQTRGDKKLIDGDACVLHMFNRILNRRLITNSAGIINIYVTDIREIEHLSYSLNAGFLTIDYYLPEWDFSKPEYEKKQAVLNIIYHVLCHLCVKENWDINVVMDVYNQCMNLKIHNEWWFKDKLFTARNRKYHVGLCHIYNINNYEIFLVLFDHDKKELIRHLIFKEKFESFQIKKISWIDNDTIRYCFDGPKKQFEYTVNDLLSSNVQKLPEKVHLLFKK
jgi:hypothetical protein